MAIHFLDLFPFLTSAKDPESEKKKRLKYTGKNITSNRYSKYYKVNQGEVEPVLGKFFFDAYRVISPAQVFLHRSVKTATLKSATIYHFLDSNDRDLQEKLSWASIEERATTTPIKELVPHLRRELKLLTESLDANKIKAINNCYALLVAFAQFAAFDFLILLKKFDPGILEHNFTRPPVIAAVPGIRVGEDIKDFLEVAIPLDPDQDWANALEVLKDLRGGTDLVGRENWRKLLVLLRDIKRSKILEYMVQYIDRDPLWQPKAKVYREDIATSWLNERRKEVSEAITQIASSKRNDQLAGLLKQVFGDSEISGMKHYTEKAGELYHKKNFDGFSHTEGMGYLAAFCNGYVKKDVRDLCDFLLVRGQWKMPHLSKPLSEGLYSALDLADRVLAFDDALSDSGEHGARLKGAITKVDRDKGEARYIRIILNTVNEDAAELLGQAYQVLVFLGKSLKQVQEDYDKSAGALIVNWKELETHTPVPPGAWFREIYRKIYYFAQILHMFHQTTAKSSASSGEPQGEP